MQSGCHALRLLPEHDKLWRQKGESGNLPNSDDAGDLPQVSRRHYNRGTVYAKSAYWLEAA